MHLTGNMLALICELSKELFHVDTLIPLLYNVNFSHFSAAVLLHILASLQVLKQHLDLIDFCMNHQVHPNLWGK